VSYPERVRTQRLILRRWDRGDRAAFEQIWLDPDVWRSLRPGAVFERGYGARRFEHHLEHWARYGFGLWAAQQRVDDEIVGWVGCAHPTFVDELAAEVEVGWTLRRAYWGRGFASEGAAAALTAGFDELDVERLISLIAPSNAASIAVARRLGMRHHSVIDHPSKEGRARDLHVYALDKRPKTTSAAFAGLT
jgi:RimJ/RimL family protein N-acetyltransferase